MMTKFREGSVVEFHDIDTGDVLDGVVWRVIPECNGNFSLFIRFVKDVDFIE